MGMSDDNLARLKDAYAQWDKSKGTNEQVWLDLMADNIRILSLAAGAPGAEFTREVRSKDDLRRYFQGLRDDWEMIHYTPDHFLVDGDRVSVLSTMRWRHRKTGGELNSPKADFIRFKDGKIVEFYEFYDTAAMKTAMQSGGLKR
jgi:ketosteroid isomerase-like protein